MNEGQDDLAEILAPRQGMPSAQLRDQLLRVTEVRLRRFRRLARGLRVASLAAVFGAGGVAGWLSRPTPPREVGEVAIVEIPIVVPVIVPVSVPVEMPTPGPLPVAARRGGDQIEQQAELEDDAKIAAGLYRTAGDAFLRDDDYANAARCYRLYLARAGDTALSLKPDDSWLLVSLKNAAFQEKVHERKAGS